MTNPFVSVIIPCRNEEQYIAKCLETILAQDYPNGGSRSSATPPFEKGRGNIAGRAELSLPPKDKMEILVVDGMSEDRTREIVKDYSEKHPFIKLLDNPNKFAPSGLNIGIKNSRGEVIIRMDAHAGYEKDYVSKCVNYLSEYNADNVGGVIKTMAAKDSLMAKAVALSLSHRFGAASDFRKGAEKPKEVDTVFGGCYKRKVFDKIGLFNENLVRSQDLEFNLRLKQAGGKIVLHPDIVSYYYPKATLKEFFWHNFQDGSWTIFAIKFVKTPFKLRHYLPLIFVLTLPLSIWPYILASLFFSAQIAMRQRDFRLFFLMSLTFFARHFGYGIGSVFGLIKLFIKA